MFYGLSIYMPEFKNTDIRLVTFLLGLAEIPADIVPIVALNRYEDWQYFIRKIFKISGRNITKRFNYIKFIYRFGRRYSSVFNYLMGGMVCIITGFIPIGYFTYEWPIVLLSLIGKYASQVRYYRY